VTFVTAVIPFYQRRAGLLRRAIESALAQKGDFDLEVIVVDDGSPAPAGPELADLPVRADRLVRLLQQPNRGAAGARNTALDALDRRTDFVAFLDSDDAWASDHLERALRALGTTDDIFFANHRRHDQPRDVFSAMSYRPPSTPLGDNLYHHAGNFLEDLLLNSPIGTSTLVMRADCIGALHFPEGWQHAHEDQLFLIAVAERARGVAFSTLEACDYGTGVNIYYAAAKPDSPAGARFADDILHYIAVVGRRPGLTPAVRAHLQAYRQHTLEGLAWHLRHCVSARQAPDWSSLARILRRDPMALGRLLVIAAGMATTKLRRLAGQGIRPGPG
jgi:succinoglycan biosynthesis protein ExoW